MKKALIAALVLLVSIAAFSDRAHGFLADARTDPPGATQLFLSAGVPAPTGTLMWFVADVALNGVPTAPLPGAILGPDDVLIRQDMVDGALLGNQPGKFTRAGIPVSPDSLSNAAIIVYLWNVLTNTPVGLAGQTFGILNLGVVPVPEIGNPIWSISSPIFANQFTVIPEPSSFLLAALGMVSLLAIRRRRNG